MAAPLDPMSTDRLNDLPSVPGRLIYDGAPVEVSREGKWVPGIVIGADDHDPELGFAIDVDIGSTVIFVTSYDHIRPADQEQQRLYLDCGCRTDGPPCVQHDLTLAAFWDRGALPAAAE